ncbi:prolyl oligopeptidase family serine peptidase [soil metagenome]
MYRPLLLAFAFVISLPLFADEPPTPEQLEKQIAELQAKLAALKGTPAPTAKKPLTIAEAETWKFARGTALSNDGKWFAYRVGAMEGDAELVLRNVADGKETRYSAGGGGGVMQFSFDSKWLAISVSPFTKPGGLLGSLLPKPKQKVVLIKLDGLEKSEFEGMAGFQFSGEACTHIAFRKAFERGDSPPGTVPTPPSFSGTDLLIRELATGSDFLLGNVSEYGFDKKGQWLVTVIDAAGQIGNGVHLRELATGLTTTLDSAKASYKSLSWHEDGNAFALMKAVEDKDYDGKWHTLLAFNTLGAKAVKTVYDPKDDKDFPKDMAISANRGVTWTQSFDALTFGISEQKKKDAAKKDEKKEAAPAPKTEGETPKGPRRPPTGGPAPTGSPADASKPDLVIWHWQDERLQPAQQLTASMEKLRTDLCLYRVKEKKFIRLADDNLKSVTLAAKQKFAIGLDAKPYQYMSTLNGQRFQDIYVIDCATGGRKKILTKARWYFGTSPTGTQALYYDDGHYYVHDLVEGTSINITQAVTATSFIDTDDDHNVKKPPTRSLGWSKDGKHVLISDDWDLWQVSTDGSGGTNLTVNGKQDQIRYTDFVQFDPESKEPGFDFSKPALIKSYGEWTKKEGIGRLAAGKPGVAVLQWADCSFGPLSKARSADVYTVTKQTAIDYPDYYTTNAEFKTLTRATTINPQQKDYNWCSGTMLVDYKGVDGKKLQGALFLPANYEKGKKYPTVVYIYEKLSENIHKYVPPGTSGFNESIYTSNGYAVFMPDLAYRLNDPGISALECMLPALDAAVATGIVDNSKIGLQGHSWGGYQTAFLVTQTNRFKAAVAGAPLTDLISMYSSVYWNSGSANQPIFESSQGRFTGGYWEQEAAYVRNSPVFNATKVQTPLVILHNDKDGAVDFSQGVEYFNTLRRLQKPVVMLQYKGENHGLVQPANRKDYSVRMKEFFDFHLQGKPAPDWWTEGVPHLKMDEHLKKRK